MNATKPAVYIAAPFPTRHEMRRFRDEIEALGHTVTSTWIDVEPDEDATSWDHRERAAIQCLEEVAAADILLIVTDDPHAGRGGRHVEMGYALALGKRIWRIGPRTHAFTALTNGDAVNLAHMLALVRAGRLDRTQ